MYLEAQWNEKEVGQLLKDFENSSAICCSVAWIALI